MALIKCPECGREISEFAPHCIGCGCPMTKIKQMLNNKPQEEMEENNKKTFWDSITDAEWRFLDNFKEALEEAMPNRFIFVKPNYYFGIKLRGEKQYRFHFAKPKDVLLFIYSPIDSKESKKLEVISLSRAMMVSLLNIIKLNISASTSTKSAKIKTTKTSNDVDVLPRGFLYSLPLDKQHLVTSFDISMRQRIGSINIQDNVRKRTYSIRTNHKKITLCWFTFRNKKLVLKYYLHPGVDRAFSMKTPSFLDVDTIANAIGNIVDLKLAKKPVIEVMRSTEKKPEIVQSKAKELKKQFLFLVSDDARAKIETFNKLLTKKYPEIEQIEAQANFLYKPENNNIYAFWFLKEPDGLVFKYRTDIDKRSSSVSSVIANNYSPEKLIEIVDNIFDKTSIVPVIYPSLISINDLIIKAFKGRKVQNVKYRDVAIAVAEYTTDYIFNKYKDIKRFKDREEFDKFKSRYSDYTYHGRNISFKFVTNDDAEYMLKYYIASRFLGIVQSYENAFGRIIEDYKLALKEYFRLLDKNSDDYLGIKGVNSNIKYVPYNLFETELKKYCA